MEGILNPKIFPISLLTPIQITVAVLQLTVAVKLSLLSYTLHLASSCSNSVFKLIVYDNIPILKKVLLIDLPTSIFKYYFFL